MAHSILVLVLSAFTFPSYGGTVTFSAKMVPHIPKPPECGLSSVQTNRIVGGREVHLGEYSWYAMYKFKTLTKGETAICGGALITHFHVITAAHCTVETVPRLGKVYLRGTDIDIKNEISGGYNISTIVKHHDYNKITVVSRTSYNGTHANDIAILLLAEIVIYTDTVRPICLTDKFEPDKLAGLQLQVVGHGDTKYNGNASSKLIGVSIPVLSMTFCYLRYKKWATELGLDVVDTFGKKVLCVGELDGGRGTCQGDSGGPLSLGFENETWGKIHYLVGIVSMSYRCASRYSPTIYTSIHFFYDWITRTILLNNNTNTTPLQKGSSNK